MNTNALNSTAYAGVSINEEYTSRGLRWRVTWRQGKARNRQVFENLDEARQFAARKSRELDGPIALARVYDISLPGQPRFRISWRACGNRGSEFCGSREEVLHFLSKLPGVAQ